ncbi:MAG: sugar phosphate isomerase/epimerase family protein [Candidatus Latescibacterota bacterium]|jgi:sugar phosphate isomerase/epimerase
MRLCWNDWFNGPLGEMRIEEAKTLYAMGFRVAGINSGYAEATDKEIDHVKRIFEETGLVPGPYGAGRAVIHQDPAISKQWREQVKKALVTAGKLGCTGLRYSVGSMNPKDIWMHHPDNHTQKTFDLLIQNTKELVPYAEDAGVMLCPETTQFTIVNTIEKMKEYCDRLDSPFATIIFDPVNHTTSERAYETGRYVQCAIAYLGDRIGEIHVKDVMVDDKQLVVHIDETPMGTGLMDHAAIMKASVLLQPWKTFSLEHIADRNMVKKAFDYIQGVADKIGHTWTDPKMTRARWIKENKK